ncbi:DDE-type integrase/transposase/recombinase [Xinfangfangia sp. CPCC 101601]|uniref:DDE-type integrase/transposase/recombinase n=1 Tax=Pseudogemmobacter lacusdianii TaxID=3069608 RepID=A0ABU0W1H7_9RHOB|nr:DDE-type integrase/transposase/recombinase [Xinfangfangia sp. CPCC 101601]MDQ2067871.1 DDE-type integrase/transposase/recombinase [Xinfangfangia sp. CPCC 101601]
MIWRSRCARLTASHWLCSTNRPAHGGRGTAKAGKVWGVAPPGDQTFALSLFQNQSRDHSLGGAVLHPISTVAAESGAFAVRAVDHEGEGARKLRYQVDRKAALKFLRKSMNRHRRPVTIVTDRLRSYRAALKDFGRGDDRELGCWLNSRAENLHLRFRRRERAISRSR